MQQITEEQFEQEVLAAEQPVLCDFFAEWCRPCKLLAPTLDKLEGEYPGVKFVKLNADNSPTGLKFKVNSIPDIIIFNKGEIARRATGLVKEDALRAMLDDVTF